MMTSCSQLLIAGDAIGDLIFHGAAEQRARAELWFEFSSPPQEPQDGYFVRVLQ